MYSQNLLFMEDYERLVGADDQESMIKKGYQNQPRSCRVIRCHTVKITFVLLPFSNNEIRVERFLL